jgi:alanyl-tRNA synthetase
MSTILPDKGSAAVRQAFIDFFAKQKKHTFVASSSVIPHDDDTLLFANAGMNQFKPIFLGNVDPKSDMAKWKSAVNSQKCIRAGGKHNDLEDVGKDTYHHTFFEMLGNWSFGDYFKEEAISWAWELLTEVYKLDKSRLYVTYFQGNPQSGLQPDAEARDIWLRFLPAERVLPYGMKENFWEMGDTGPCGPCSEIHYDKIGGRDASNLVNADDPDVIEIWNNVFIQFNREPDGSLRSLPAKHVDTGMGLERLCSIIQGVRNNYDTDLFTPLFEAIQKVTGFRSPYGGKVGKDDTDTVDMAYRVIADHIRTLTFSINDGAMPSNEGRGYVLRRILRRAVRYGKQILGAPTGFFHKLVPVVVGKMSAAFPELQKNPQHIINTLKDEEEMFGRTLDKGLLKFEKILKKVVAAGGNRISGADAFKLFSTYGFPFDLTRLMAAEKGVSVDEEAFNTTLHETKEKNRLESKKEAKATLKLNNEGVSFLKKRGVTPTEDSSKYFEGDLDAVVVALWTGTELVDSFTTTDSVAVVLNKTNFYAESGGQIFDTGSFIVNQGATFTVEDVKTFGGFVTHVVRGVQGATLKVGDTVTLKVDYQRRAPIRSNHTSTHMLNFALRSVLGLGVEQEGSLVDNERLRFDFSYGKPLFTEQVQKVDAIVTELIVKELPVYAKEVSLPEAKRIQGLRAVFGEVYPDPVRVVSIGKSVEELTQNPTNADWQNFSIELCGGTHLSNTRDARAFTVVSEETVGSGVRRIVAVTGKEALAAATTADNFTKKVDSAAKLEGKELEQEVLKLSTEFETLVVPLVHRDRLNKALENLREKIKEASKSNKASQQKDALQFVDLALAQLTATPAPFFVSVTDVGGNAVALTNAIKGIQDKFPATAILLLSADVPKKKVAIVSNVPAALQASGLKANEWAQKVAMACGGKGGGKAEVAQGQGNDPTKIQQAVEEATSYAKSKLLP